MKIIAVIDDGLQSREAYEAGFAKLRREYAADRILVICSGDYLYAGYPAPSPAADRGQMLVEAGADLCIEMPPHAVLLKQDSYVFALAMLLQKLNCIHALVLPCAEGSQPMLERIEKMLLQAPGAYMKELLRLKKTMDLEEAVPAAAEAVIPGAEAILHDPRNRSAVELRTTLIRNYCTVRTEYVSGLWDACTPGISPEADAALGARLCELLTRETEATLGEIFGGTVEITRQAVSLAREPRTFTEFARALSRPQFPRQAARQYLLRCLLGVRSIDHSTAALYSYIRCIRICARRSGDTALTDYIRSHASLPIQTC